MSKCLSDSLPGGGRRQGTNRALDTPQGRMPAQAGSKPDGTQGGLLLSRHTQACALSPNYQKKATAPPACAYTHTQVTLLNLPGIQPHHSPFQYHPISSQFSKPDPFCAQKKMLTSTVEGN